MHLPTYFVNTFTDQLFAGNPAAVSFLPNWLAAEQLQAIAAEHAVPATAFICQEQGVYHIRWFTPDQELELCGHGTLAAAAILFTEIMPAVTEYSLRFASGLLSIKYHNGLFTLNLPAKHMQKLAQPPENKALAALPVKAFYHCQQDRAVVVVDSYDAVNEFIPDFPALAQLNYRGIVLTGPGKGDIDFVSRTFYPSAQIKEDPVTGVSHCLLVPYWAKALNKTYLHARQLSARGGNLITELQADRVELSGKARIYLQGQFNYE